MRRRIPSRWTSPAESTKAPMRVQWALRSRLKGYVPSGRTGTSGSPHLRRYYKDASELEKHVRGLQRAGVDVQGELLAMGSVYLSGGGVYQQLYAIEVICLFLRGPDTSPHHYRDSQLPAPASPTLEPLVTGERCLEPNTGAVARDGLNGSAE